MADTLPDLENLAHAAPSIKRPYKPRAKKAQYSGAIGEFLPDGKILPHAQTDLSTIDTSMSDLDLAKICLRNLMLDPNTPAAAKAQAARTFLEMIGAIGRHAEPPKDAGRPIGEMTREEMLAELSTLKASE